MALQFHCNSIVPMTFLDPLDIRDMGDGKNWILLHEFRYSTQDGRGITVPAGFITDFASTPRFMWRICPPATGLYRRAAVVHDWLYRVPDESFTRDAADGIFLEAMEETGVPWWKRKAMYRAVRMFGGPSYQARA